MTQTPKNNKATTVKKTDERVRWFATVIYPTEQQYKEYYETHKQYQDKETGELLLIPEYKGEEGWGQTPDDWLEILDATHIAILISPMHIGDKNPDGTPKKPHRHVLVIYEGKKNFETQVKPLFDKIGGVGREEVLSLRGYARYLLHLDNPEKFQYSRQDLIQLGGADFETIIKLPGDSYKQFNDIQKIIDDKDFISVVELIKFLDANNPDLKNAAMFTVRQQVKDYIKSKAWTESPAGVAAKAQHEEYLKYQRNKKKGH